MTSAHKDFKYRHIGTSSADQLLMLKTLGYDSIDDLMSDAVPQVMVKARCQSQSVSQRR